MNTKILNTEVLDFICKKSIDSIDLSTLILSGSPFKEISIQELAQQIQGKRKAKSKLPTWYSNRKIYYPKTVNLEQTSSEITAAYKSKLVSGKSLIDLTGGFGVDSYYFSKRIEHVIHCEQDELLSSMVTYNFEILNVKNCTTIIGDGIDILKNHKPIDWVYIDPSRRHSAKGKVFFLEDCVPNIINHLDLFFDKSKNIMIKTSPMLDIKTGIDTLQYVKEVHIIAVQNEVKELLWILEKDYNNSLKIETINLLKEKDQKFSFYPKKESKLLPNLATPSKYLYEPNAAILKSGGFLSIGNTLGLKKLHLHSHLYTSDSFFDFPGRVFIIIAVYPYHKKTIAKTGITKANITVRNFPESVTILRKKLTIKDGGNDYLFFTTDYNHKKIMIHCKKTNTDYGFENTSE